MSKNQPHKSGAHSAAASKSPKRPPSTKSSEASLATSSEEHSEEAERRPSHPTPQRQQQPQRERKPQHQQVQQPQQEWQPQQQPQQVQQVPMFYQAPTPMLPMQAGMQGQVFVDPNDPNTLHYEGFDPGARFSKLAPPRVPPPPPGVLPNPAQLALMQGHNVVVTQRKSNVISGGSSGGVDTSCTIQ